MTEKADIAVVGLAVMGANLALNLTDMGNAVAVYNRTTEVTDRFMAEEGAEKGVLAAEALGRCR